MQITSDIVGIPPDLNETEQAKNLETKTDNRNDLLQNQISTSQSFPDTQSLPKLSPRGSYSINKIIFNLLFIILWCVVNIFSSFLVSYIIFFSCFKFLAFTCVTLHGSVYVYKVYTGIHNIREMWSYFYYWLHKSIVYQKIHSSRGIIGSTIVWHWRKPMQGPENRTR